MATTKTTILKKVPSLGQTFQPNKDNMRNYETLQGLDKKVKAIASVSAQNAINQALAQPGVFGETLFIGYFINGGNVSVNSNQVNFRSLIDGYQYSQTEVESYSWVFISTRTAGVGFIQGQTTFPGIAAANSGAGQVYWTYFNLDDLTGGGTYLVTTQVSYFDGVEHITTDGLIKVFASVRRKSA